MFPPSETPRPSGTSSSKLNFITSLRRLTAKSKHEPASTEPEYVPRTTRISSLTMESVIRVSHPARASSSAPRRVRMSGSRLPSGYKSNVAPKPPPQPSLKHPIEQRPKPSSIHPTSPPPLHTRLTRFISGHTRAASVSTPTSSTLSFPSSSRASTSTTTSNPKTVRFSPSTSFVRGTSQRSQPQDKVEERGKIARWSKRPSLVQGRDEAASGER